MTHRAGIRRDNRKLSVHRNNVPQACDPTASETRVERETLRDVSKKSSASARSRSVPVSVGGKQNVSFDRSSRRLCFFRVGFSYVGTEMNMKYTRRPLSIGHSRSLRSRALFVGVRRLETFV